MEILRDIHWDSYLVQMVELRQDPPVGCHTGIDMSILRDLQWKSRNLGQKQ